MKYAGFLCLGLVIMTIAISLLGLVIGMVSQETLIRQKAQKLVAGVFPLALILLGFGWWQVH